jgi:hypothetical protein
VAAWQIRVHKVVLVAAQSEAFWIHENFGAAAQARFEHRINAVFPC